MGGTDTFEPDVCAAWHTHPLGQTLIVTAGCGIVFVICLMIFDALPEL